MRKILFRGKREDNRQWVYGDYLFRQYKKMDNKHYIVTREGYSYSIDEKTLGQYTGLKDKNGKKIFEGDVLKYSDEPNVEVVYNVEFAMFIVINENTRYYCQLGFLKQPFLEVIGNIHDTLKLVEVK